MLGHDRLRQDAATRPAVVETGPGAQHVCSRCPASAHGRKHADEGLKSAPRAVPGFAAASAPRRGCDRRSEPSPPGMRGRAAGTNRAAPGRDGQARLGRAITRSGCDRHHPRDGQLTRPSRGRPAHEHPSRGAALVWRAALHGFTECDIVRALAAEHDAAGHTVTGWMTHDPITLPPRPRSPSPRTDVAGGLPPHPDPGRPGGWSASCLRDLSRRSG